MNIEFNYDITDCDPEELGKEIFSDFSYIETGICINAIFTDANFATKFKPALLQTLSDDVKDELRKALFEEEKPEPTTEVFYKVGDKFKHPAGIYKLCSLGNSMVALVKIERRGGDEIGNIFVPYGSDYSVKDHRHITKEEFSHLADGLQYSFTLIKED